MTHNAAADISALQSMAGRIDELPLLPQILVQILQLHPTSERYFEEFERLAKEDPAFAVRIIAVANSASSSPAVPITSIGNALTRLGTKTIVALVASLAVQRVFMPTKPNQVRLWQHSIFTAVASQRIAELAKTLQIEPAEAYLSGLLHDIGRFIMFEHAPENLQKVDESNWRSPGELIQADVEIFKYTHSELGSLACAHWGMPEAIAAVVKDHHSPVADDIQAGSGEALTFCVQIADRLCISILEEPALEDLTAEENATRIKFDVLQTSRDQRLVSATSLAESLDPIREESINILSGLGFAP